MNVINMEIVYCTHVELDYCIVKQRHLTPTAESARNCFVETSVKPLPSAVTRSSVICIVILVSADGQAFATPAPIPRTRHQLQTSIDN